MTRETESKLIQKCPECLKTNIGGEWRYLTMDEAEELQKTGHTYVPRTCEYCSGMFRKTWEGFK